MSLTLLVPKKADVGEPKTLGQLPIGHAALDVDGDVFLRVATESSRDKSFLVRIGRNEPGHTPPMVRQFDGFDNTQIERYLGEFVVKFA
jgi:hypothetical protein